MHTLCALLGFFHFMFYSANTHVLDIYTVPNNLSNKVHFLLLQPGELHASSFS